MKDLKRILAEITHLTSTIEGKYPELYQFLDENPITIAINDHPEVDAIVLQDYLGSLKQLLKHHIETHKNKK